MIISTQGLGKRYARVFALSSLSLDVAQGEVLGLLGPNGSGKTTTIRLLLGLLKPTTGSASVAGFDCWRKSLDVRRLISYLPGELRPFGAMTGRGYLEFLCSLRDGVGLDRSTAIAERVMGLDLRKKVRAYSTGMKQKLSLAQVFSDPVDILILDEPTSALDPSARQDVIRLVLEAKARGQTVIFSGHVLSEVEQVADRVAIMRQGKLMHIENMHTRRALRMVLARFPGEAPKVFPEELKLTLQTHENNVVLLEHRGEVGPLLAWLLQSEVVDLAIGTEDLRSLYDRYHGPNALPDADKIPLMDL